MGDEWAAAEAAFAAAEAEADARQPLIDSVSEVARAARAAVVNIRNSAKRETVKVNVEKRQPGAAVDVEVAGCRLRGCIPAHVAPDGRFQIQLPPVAKLALLKETVDAETRDLTKHINGIVEAAREHCTKAKVAMEAAMREQRSVHENKVAQLRAQHKKTLHLVVEAANEQCSSRVAKAKATMDALLRDQCSAHESEIALLKAQHDAETRDATLEAAREQCAQNAAGIEAALREQSSTYESEIARLKAQHEAETRAAHKRGRDEALAAALTRAENLARTCRRRCQYVDLTTE